VQCIGGKTVTVKIKYSDFTQATRSRTGIVPFANAADVLDAASGLLATVYPFKRPVRLLGVTLSSLTNDQPSGVTGSRNSISTCSRDKAPKPKKPAAGGGAAGFSKRTEQLWEEECRCSDRRPLGGGVGRLKSKLCGRRCIASIGRIIHRPWTVPMFHAALQLCKQYKSERPTNGTKIQPTLI